uniref:Uncharacterized protein n=1 Tax=Rhizophora mucronata TaxID=61149 RepID=A0A2P2N3R4_RHIMU
MIKNERPFGWQRVVNEFTSLKSSQKTTITKGSIRAQCIIHFVCHQQA